MTDQDQSKLSTFHTKCLGRILRIFWPNTINNEELLRKCNQLDMATILTRRRWKWLGHVIRKDSRSHTKTALHWTPDGKRKRGGPKTTWRRTVEAELKEINQTWGPLKGWLKIATNGEPLLLPYIPAGITGNYFGMSLG
ncbi:uncharacterized protein LOC144620670 [Crassostrea virginica]